MEKLCIVVPCYNEQEIIIDSNNKLLAALNNLINKEAISPDSKIMYIDDGSKDNTWQLMTEIQAKFNEVTIVKLSKNVGHQNALYAGLMIARKDFHITISIDADLQDDILIFKDFINSYRHGAEIVYGVRKERKSDTIFKKYTALLFYKFMHLLGVEVINNHADYRLMSKKSLDTLSNYEETNLFLRGMIPLLGYKTDKVYYNRLERLAGESKYNLRKMLNLAWDGVTSFSVKPIRVIFSTGIMITLVGFTYTLNVLWLKYHGHTVTGWSSIIASIWLLGGFQVMSIGIIGEYIAKVYMETKRRPKYNVECIFKTKASSHH